MTPQRRETGAWPEEATVTEHCSSVLQRQTTKYKPLFHFNGQTTYLNALLSVFIIEHANKVAQNIEMLQFSMHLFIGLGQMEETIFNFLLS